MDLKHLRYSWLEDAKSLISTITDIQDNDENFNLCLEYVASNFSFCQDAQAYSADIYKSAQRLVDKMSIQCNLTKANKLQTLINRLLPASNESYASALLLILRLSESTSDGCIPRVETSASSDDDIENFSWSEHLRENDDDFIISSCADDLSDWSGSEENIDLLHVKIVGPKREDSGIDVSADARSATSLPAVITPIGRPSDTGLNIPLLESSSSYLKNLNYVQKKLVDCYWSEGGSKVNVKTNQNIVGNNLQQKWNSYIGNVIQCESDDGVRLTETQVVRETLWMLMGVQSFIFHFDPKKTTYTFTGKAFVSHLTPKALENLLDEICTYANTLTILRIFVKNTLEGGANVEGSARSCRTFEAFASSLNEYLNDLRLEFVKMEATTIRQDRQFSLNDVVNRLSAISDQLEEIHLVYKIGIGSMDRLALSNNRSRAANLISKFYDRLIFNNLIESNSVLLSMFLQTCRPFIDTIDRFVTKGVIKDPCQEFFISRDENMNTKDEHYWSKAYKIQVTPGINIKLFENIQDRILTAGKSVEILETLGSSPHTISKLCPERSTLFENFVNNLKNSLKSINERQEVKTKLDPTSDIASRIRNIGIIDPYLIQNFKDLASKSRVPNPPLPKTDIVSRPDSDHRPFSLAASSALDTLIESKCAKVSAKFIEILKTDFHLMSIFSSIKKHYLMEAGDVIFSFCSSLFTSLRAKEKLNDMEVNAMFIDAVDHSYPQHESVMSVSFECEDFDCSVVSPIYAVGQLVLHHKVDWPANVIFTKRSFIVYNRIFKFLLQIKFAKFVLNKMSFKGKRGSSTNFFQMDESGWSQKFHIMCLLRSRLLHFVDTLHNYLMTEVLNLTNANATAMLEEAESVESALEVHENYLDIVCRRCLCHPSTSIVKQTILKVLEVVRNFDDRWQDQSNNVTYEEMREVETTFVNCNRFMSTFLGSHLLRTNRSFPQLETLVATLDADNLPSLLDSFPRR